MSNKFSLNNLKSLREYSSVRWVTRYRWYWSTLISPLLPSMILPAKNNSDHQRRKDWGQGKKVGKLKSFRAVRRLLTRLMSENIPVAGAFTITQESSFKLQETEHDNILITKSIWFLSVFEWTWERRGRKKARKPDKKKKLFQRGSCLGMEMSPCFLLEIWDDHMMPSELKTTAETQRERAILMKPPWEVLCSR